MIKGINKNIIEITETKSLYYEKSILFIKPEYLNLKKNLLEKEAISFINNAGKPSYIRKKNKTIALTIKIILSAFLGGLAASVFMNFII